MYVGAAFHTKRTGQIIILLHVTELALLIHAFIWMSFILDLVQWWPDGACNRSHIRLTSLPPSCMQEYYETLEQLDKEKCERSTAHACMSA